MAGASSGIYQIRCSTNGKVYVGQSQHLSRRWGEHKRLLRTGKHFNRHLQFAWNKYGETSFSFHVLGLFRPELLTFAEGFLIREGKGNLFNIIVDPSRPMMGRKHTPESIEKMRRAHTGKKFTALHRKHLSDSIKASKARIIS